MFSSNNYLLSKLERPNFRETTVTLMDGIKLVKLIKHKRGCRNEMYTNKYKV